MSMLVCTHFNQDGEPYIVPFVIKYDISSLTGIDIYSSMDSLFFNSTSGNLSSFEDKLNILLCLYYKCSAQIRIWAGICLVLHSFCNCFLPGHKKAAGLCAIIHGYYYYCHHCTDSWCYNRNQTQSQAKTVKCV